MCVCMCVYVCVCVCVCVCVSVCGLCVLNKSYLKQRYLAQSTGAFY